MSYDSEVLADVPKGYWKLQETTGTTAADSSGLARSGTYTGSAGTNYTFNQASLLATEPATKSVLLSRTGSATDTWGTTGGLGRIVIPYHADWCACNTSFSAEIWFKTAAITTDYLAAQTINRHLDSSLLARRNSAPLQHTLRLTTAGAGQGVLWNTRDTATGSSPSYSQQSIGTQHGFNANYPDFMNPDGTYIFGSGAHDSGPFDGNPHHLIMTFDYALKRFRTYMDGYSYAYVDLPSAFAIEANTVDGLVIGGNFQTTNSNGFIGWISHAAWYRTALSESRVIAHYFAGSGNYTTIYVDYVTQSAKGEVLTQAMTFGATQVNYDAPVLRQTMTFTSTQVDYMPTSVTITDSFGVSSPVVQNTTTAAVVAETVTNTADLTGVRGQFATATDTLTFGSTLSFAQVLTAAIREGLSIRVGFTSDDTDYVGWTMNANTGATSMYDEFAFNSFAKIGTNYYGCRGDGIYELVGELDDTKDINVSVLLPNTDFGSSNLKRIAKAYFGIRSNGGVQLRVITNDGEENTYLLDRDNGVIKEARMEFGRGLRSRYWQLELKNVAGSDFALDEIELMLNTTTRRI